MPRHLQARTLRYTRTSPQRAAGRARRAKYRGLEHDLDTRRNQLATRPGGPLARNRVRAYAWIAGAAALAALAGAVLASIAGIAAAGAVLAIGLALALVAALVLWVRWSRATSSERRTR